MYNGRRQTTNKCTIHVSPIALIEKNVFTQPRWTIQQKRRVDNSKKKPYNSCNCKKKCSISLIIK